MVGDVLAVQTNTSAATEQGAGSRSTLETDCARMPAASANATVSSGWDSGFIVMASLAVGRTVFGTDGGSLQLLHYAISHENSPRVLVRGAPGRGSGRSPD